MIRRWYRALVCDLFHWYSESIYMSYKDETGYRERTHMGTKCLACGREIEEPRKVRKSDGNI